MKTILWAALLTAALRLSASAQWNAKWLQDESYWGDGKAEFNIYEAREVRYGQPRPSIVVHIFVRESFAGDDLVKADDWKRPGTYSVLKLNQVLYVPTGIYTYQQMHSAFWKTDSGQLIKASLTSSDSCGNTYKEFRALNGWRSWLGAGWKYHWHTYWQGMSEGSETIRVDKDAIFYDELPMRVRSIDFSGAREGTFAVPVADGIIKSKKDSVAFSPTIISWRQKPGSAPDASGEVMPGSITVTVKPRSGPGEDVFVLDGKPPHLLREWAKRDGGTLKLKHSLKIDYWNYNKLGDFEKVIGPLSAPSERDHEEMEEEENEE
jgi:hypothetical protein